MTDAEEKRLQSLVLAAVGHDRKRAQARRGVINATLYVLRGGIAWQLLAESFLLWRPVFRRFTRLRGERDRESPNHPSVMLARERRGRAASPSATLTDSQSTNTIAAGSRRSRGAGNKAKGRKGGARVDADGRALAPQAHATRMEICDRVGRWLRVPRRRRLFTQLGYVDRAYAGPRAASAIPSGIAVARKAEGQVRFAAQSRFWIVQRFPSHRPTATGALPTTWVTTTAFVRAFQYTASVMLLLCRPARR